MPIYDGVFELIGKTPLVRLGKLSPPAARRSAPSSRAKNPGGSVKDRPALAMLLAAEAEWRARPGATLVEATSGNTGISLAMLAAARGYRCVLVMPEDASMARRLLLKAYGAELVLTDALDGHGRRGRQGRGHRAGDARGLHAAPVREPARTPRPTPRPRPRRSWPTPAARWTRSSPV